MPAAVVVVVIPTFRRAEQVAAAVDAVLHQVVEARIADDGVIDYRVLVVDNDVHESARDVLASRDVAYVVEPRPGIAAARNRALEEASDARAVIFIDDDEVPEPGWLRSLVQMWRQTDADAVAGRVVTRFPARTSAWVRASGAFIRPVRTDGQRMAEAASNNLLLDMRSVRQLHLTFDERFGLTGGSDSMFTRTLAARGGDIRWSQDAVVLEQEDDDRFVRSWVLMRTFRFGNTSGRVALALPTTRPNRVRARASVFAKGCARVGAGAVRVLWGTATRSLPHRARGERTVARGAGMVAAVVGYSHDEYGRRRRSADRYETAKTSRKPSR